METYQLEQDVHVFCKAATSFPDGILEAHQSLHRLVSFSPQRKYYGISWMDKNGEFVYKAAAEELTPGELSKHNLDPFTIHKGEYVYLDIKNFRDNIPAIGQAFDELKSDKRIDPQGVAVEWYLNDTDVRCMIRLKS
jgi:predicted transcriptional regulator YdeE